MNKNALSLFLFVGFVSCNFVIKSMQPPKQPDISTFFIDRKNADRKNATPVSMFFETPQYLDDLAPAHDFVDSTIEKISDNQYEVVFKGDSNGETYRLPLDQHKLSSILENSLKSATKKNPIYDVLSGEPVGIRETRYSHLKVSISGLKDVYIKIGQDKINTALVSQLKKSKKKPQKVVVSSASSLDEQDAPTNPVEPQNPVEKTRREPIHPKDFKMPYTIPATDSPEDIGKIIKSLKKEKQEELDSKAKELLEQEKKIKEQKNKETLKAFNLGFHLKYQKKIANSIQSWDENPSLRRNEKEKFIAINEERKKLGFPPLTPEAYFDLLKANHIIELGSWHLKQYKQYNETLERENQPLLVYEKFHEEMQKSRLGSTEQTQEKAFTDLLKEMDNQAQSQFAFIKKINEKTERIQAEHDQYSAVNYLKSRGHQLPIEIGTNEFMIVAAQGVRSLFPRQDVAEAIDLYDTAILDKQREMVFQKEALSLMETKEELEKKLNRELFSRVEKNQKKLHPEGRKSEQELLNSLKKQRDKHVQK